MAEVIINPNDIEKIIKNYNSTDNKFVFRSYLGSEKKKICKFYMNSKECRLDIFIKNKSVNIIPVGTNIDEAKILLEYIMSKGFSKEVAVKQFSFDCSEEIIQKLKSYIDENWYGIIKYIEEGNMVRFEGYNRDEVIIHFYATKNKAMIQARPYETYSIIITFLTDFITLDLDKFIEFNNNFIGINKPSSAVRDEMKNKLEKSYNYLDEALLKSISGSISLINQECYCEDYTGLLAGVFKGLEGYLKKILKEKYNFRLTKRDTFSMFYRREGNPSIIDLKNDIEENKKQKLNELYSLYSNKRNVYLHATIDPSLTRIITNKKEAESLADQILTTIKDSYNIIF